MVATKTSKTLISFCLLTAVGLFGCSKKSAEQAGGGATQEIRIYTWSDYLQDSMIKDFEKNTGYKVKLDYFSSNEEMMAKVQSFVQSGSPGYDLVMPSDYMVTMMAHLQLLLELDHAKLPFLKEFAPEFQSPAYDPGLRHAVPVAWGTTGVAVDTAQAKKFKRSEGISWRDFFENKDYAGHVTLLDDAKEVFDAALMILGKDWAQATLADVEAAYHYIKAHKSAVKAYTGESRPVMEAGECVLCQAYSGDVLRAQKARPSIEYVIPKEGATLWTDNFAIPKNAKNVEGAYKFLDFFLSAQRAKQFTEATYFASPNQTARQSLVPELQANSVIFPSVGDMKRTHLILERPELMLKIGEYWTEIRSE
jgi:spermidine/putrescine transport system substrate-binding protein